ncbi:hypothetical protein BT96DRAFT_915784 [Gymnopus androsaceus JB14]|uniref:DUF6593 domain-containing protein n=1 Tax=Gymnopus androsaceus JB14 TaxID=1447944 RepID=A0A6A4I785_9AGAR|nr:hypothetical protein BT96DRAFT_915784 [Gymnopus androsaceus JB14]
MSLRIYRRHRRVESITNNVYEDDQGKTLYIVHTPWALNIVNRTTTVTKALHDSPIDSVSRSSSSPARPYSPQFDDGAFFTSENQREGTCTSIVENLADADANSSDPVDEGNTGNTSPGRPRRRSRSSGEHTNFIYLAQIDWRVFKSTKIRFGTGKYSGQEVLVKDLFSKEGHAQRRSLFFTGEDGKEYRWRIFKRYCELCLNDASNTPIAKFHRAKAFSKERSYFEIFPSGLNMVDEIFVLFIYADRLRESEEGGGG